MKWVMISRVSENQDDMVLLKGWVQNRRSSGKIRFLQIRDGSGIIQCIVEKASVSAECFEAAGKAPLESAVQVWGQVAEDPRSPGGYEIRAQEMKIIAEAEEYPISKKDHGVGFLMDHRHLWLRSSKQRSLMHIRSRICHTARQYLDEMDFICCDAPILTPTSCEGTTSLFHVDYFDGSAYLTQSGQLYGEAAAMALGRIYVFGPTFRAEKSKTRRHLTEFWMLEPEMAFWELPEAIDLAEGLICRIVSDVLERCGAHMKVLERDPAKLEKISPPFPRITYTEAVEILKAAGVDFTWGEDFGAEDETIISNSFDRPVFITHYPAQAKAFYMKRDPENHELALCMDLLAPEGYGEIIGGGQREDSIQELEKRIEEHELDPAPLQWYLDLRRYGAAPHSGFGLGIERTIAWLSGIHHVRETIPFPRLMDRLYP